MDLRIAVPLLALAAASAHAATTVYKCTQPNGNVVFSAMPCGKNAQVIDTSGALRTGTSPNLQGVSDRAAIAAIDADCDSRQSSINVTASIATRAADDEIARLQRDMQRSANNYAGATRDNGLREQISAAEARKQAALAEQRNATEALRAECEKRRSEEAQRQADRDAAKAQPKPD